MSLPERAIERLGRLAAGESEADTPPSLGRYRIGRRIAAGASGVVHEAEDLELRRPVAVKLLRDLAGQGATSRQRFQREARAAGSITHPNVVQVYDAGEVEGRPYLVMELVKGRPLRRILDEEGLDLRSLLMLLEKTARGLAAAHAAGIVHRDVKPSNILVSSDGVPKVGDFGLAHRMESDSQLTRTGSALGTPLYMSPEQVAGDASRIAPATDVYALGAILYEILTGAAPHAGESVAEIFARILDSEPARPRSLRPRIARDIETICLKALEKDPARRYATAAAFAEDLGRFLAGEAVTARPPGALRRGLRWVRRHSTLSAVLAVAFVAASAGIAVDRGRAERTASALALLEEARPVLEKSERFLYRSGVDYPALHAQVELEALPRIGRAIALRPDLPLAHLLHGRALEILGLETRAEAAWKRALDVDPACAPARVRLGRLLVSRAIWNFSGSLPAELAAAQGDCARLMADGARHIEEGLRGRDEEGRVQRRVSEALLAYARGNLSGAGGIARSALAEAGRDEGAEDLRWILAVASPDTCLEELRLALELAPNHVPSIVVRGILRVDRGDLHGAIEDFSRALAIRPGLVDAQFNRGAARLCLDDLAGAIADAGEVIARDPGLASAWSLRAGAEVLEGDFPGALRDASRSIELQPDAPWGWFARGTARLMLGRRDEAITDFTRTLELRPGHRKAAFQRGQARFEGGDFPGALKDADAELRVNPRFPEAHLLRGQALLQQGEEAEAIGELEISLRLAPDGWKRKAAVEEALAGLRRGRSY